MNYTKIFPDKNTISWISVDLEPYFGYLSSLNFIQNIYKNQPILKKVLS